MGKNILISNILINWSLIKIYIKINSKKPKKLLENILKILGFTIFVHQFFTPNFFTSHFFTSIFLYFFLPIFFSNPDLESRGIRVFSLIDENIKKLISWNFKTQFSKSGEKGKHFACYIGVKESQLFCVKNATIWPKRKLV